MKKLIALGIILTITLTTIFLILFGKGKLTVTNSFTQSKNIVTIETKETSFPITLQTIFASDHSWTATLSAQKKTTIIATGDVIPARSVNKHVVGLNNFGWPFEKTATQLRVADLTLINLETPLLDTCPIIDSGFVFCGSTKNIEGLVSAGVDIASLANNHAGNYGESGVLQTADLLKKNNIDPIGISGPLIKEVNGIKFAFLGFNDITKVQPGVENVEESKIKEEIKEARSKADVVIVTYHWGVEYRDLPDSRQIYLGHFAIDNGADLVIGNHPHWIQPIEFYKGKLITYAHGNFVFDQMWSQKTEEGVVGKYIFYENKIVDVQYFPVHIRDFGQPYFLEGADKERILTEMKDGSLKLAQSAN